MNSSSITAITTINAPTSCYMETCPGCCLNNNCLSDMECKLLFFTSGGILLVGLICLLCCGCCLGIYFVYVFLKYLVQRRRKYSEIKKYDIMNNAEGNQVPAIILSEFNEGRGIRNRLK